MPQAPTQIFYDPETGKPVAKKFYNPDTGEIVPEVSTGGPSAPVGPGAGSRFGQSLWKQINPLAAVEGMYQMVAHPADTAAMITTQSILKGQEAMQAGSEGRKADAATAAVGALPFVGAPLETGIQQVRQGDYAGAAGTATGLALPFLRPLKAARVGALAGFRKVAPNLATRAATQIEKIAGEKVAKVMSPEVGANKVRLGNQAERVAPEMLSRNLTDVWSREGLHDNVQAGLARARQKLDDAADARPGWKSYSTDEVIAALEKKRAEVQAEAIDASKWPRALDKDGVPVTEPYGKTQTPAPIRARITAINRAIDEVRGLGPTARYDALRRIRAGHDEGAKPVYSPAVTPDYVKNKSAQMGEADVTGALREFLAQKDPATAAANAEFSLFKKANDVLEATREMERTRPSRGGKIMSRVAGAIAGSKVAGLLGAVGGYAIAPAVEVSVGMGMTKTLKIATNLDQLAKAIRSGSPSRVRWTAGQLKRSLAQAGVQVSNLKGGNEPPYPPMDLTPSHEPTQPPAAEPPIPRVLQGAGAGRHTLSDGSVWEKTADGSIRRVQ